MSKDKNKDRTKHKKRKKRSRVREEKGVLRRKKKSGASIYSPWYTKEFVEVKLEEKKIQLAKLEEVGDIRSGEGWNEKARRRFQLHFDRLADQSKTAYQYAAKSFGKYLGLPKAERKVSNIVARLILLSYIEATTLVEEYVNWMESDQELSPNTINVRLAALRWFVDVARRVGWVDWKLDVKNVRGGKVRDTSGPSDAEFRRILRVVNGMGGPKGSRTKALVYMLGFMGVRISSAISLDYENIDFESRKVFVKWKGKGDAKANFVWRPIGEGAFEALNDWIKVRGSHEGAVFVRMDRAALSKSKDPRDLPRMTIRSAQRDIEKVGREAATVKTLTPHGFRHFFATNNLKEEDTRKVMKATGHTNIKTIEFYDDSDDEQAREVLDSMESRWLDDLEETEEEDEAEIQERYGTIASASMSEDEEEEEAGDLEGLGVWSATKVTAAKTYNRISTGMKSVDFLFDGKGNNWGLVRGSLYLLGGKRGLGKSTIARQIGKHVCVANPLARVLYASAEETPEQIKEALVRLDCVHENLFLIGERSLNKICHIADRIGASLVIVDSISTVTVDGVNKRPGSVTQVKASGQFMLDWCKGVNGGEGSDAAVMLIAHVTSSGEIAGPEELEHHVDAIYKFDSPSKRSNMRSLACEGKNRHGASDREVFFEMTDKGLVEKTDPEGVDMPDSGYSVFDEVYEEVDDDFEYEEESSFDDED